jgi:hypothetical protein
MEFLILHVQYFKRDGIFGFFFGKTGSPTKPHHLYPSIHTVAGPEKFQDVVAIYLYLGHYNMSGRTPINLQQVSFLAEFIYFLHFFKPSNQHKLKLRDSIIQDFLLTLNLGWQQGEYMTSKR